MRGREGRERKIGGEREGGRERGKREGEGETDPGSHALNNFRSCTSACHSI